MTTAALAAAGIGSLFAQDSGLNKVLEQRGFYDALNNQAKVYDLPAESVKNFADSYIAQIAQDPSRVTFTDTVKARGEPSVESKAAMVKRNSDRDVNLLTESTRPATMEEVKNFQLHVDENRLEDYLRSNGVDVPQDDAYMDALQQANIAVMDTTSETSPSQEKERPATDTVDSYVVALGGGLADANGELAGSASLRARMLDAGKFNLYASLTGMFGSSRASDISETEEQEMQFHEPSMFEDTYMGEKTITEYEADLTEKILGDFSLTAEYELGGGFAVGLGPTVMFGQETYTNQRSLETLETYVGNEPDEAAMTQNGFEEGSWQDSDFKSDDVNAMLGGNLSLRYDRLSVDFKAAADKGNLVKGVSLLYNFGN
ncbi:MAG: hypothetical protein ACLFSN_01930 [Candidatus Woesearchaeota archaeon]